MIVRGVVSNAMVPQLFARRNALPPGRPVPPGGAPHAPAEVVV